MYNIHLNSKFRRDIERVLSKGKSIDKISEVINQLANGKQLNEKYNDHFLKWNNNYPDGTKECHIEYDWLLVYKINKSKYTLHLLRTGSHDEVL
jgi:mRNA interferase YafQ